MPTAPDDGADYPGCGCLIRRDGQQGEANNRKQGLTATRVLEWMPAKDKRCIDFITKQKRRSRFRLGRRIYRRSVTSRPQRCKRYECWPRDFVTDYVRAGRVIAMLTSEDFCNPKPFAGCAESEQLWTQLGTARAATVDMLIIRSACILELAAYIDTDGIFNSVVNHDSSQCL